MMSGLNMQRSYVGLHYQRVSPALPLALKIWQIDLLDLNGYREPAGHTVGWGIRDVFCVRIGQGGEKVQQIGVFRIGKRLGGCDGRPVKVKVAPSKAAMASAACSNPSSSTGIYGNAS